MFPIPLPLEDGRPDGTVSDDTSNSSIYESEIRTSLFRGLRSFLLSANVNKNTKYKTNSDVNLFY